MKSLVAAVVFLVGLSVTLGIAYAQEPWWRQPVAHAAQSDVRTRGPAQTDFTLTLPKAPENLVIPAESVWKMFGGLMLAIGGVGWRIGKWFWKKHGEDIDGIDKRAQAAIHDLKTTVETNRREMREGIIQLHGKVEGIDQSAQQRHGELMLVLLERNK